MVSQSNIKSSMKRDYILLNIYRNCICTATFQDLVNLTSFIYKSTNNSCGAAKIL